MTGIERLRELTEARPSLLTCDQIEELRDISDQIEREMKTSSEVEKTKCDPDDVSVSTYDLLPADEREAIAWVREHGGPENVRDAWDEAVNLCATIGCEPNDESEMLQALGDCTDIVIKRLMPEGCIWPHFADGEPVKFGEEAIGFVRKPSFIVDHVTIFAGGEATVCSGVDYGSGKVENFVRVYPRERVRRPAVPAADGEPLEVGQTVWDVDGYGPLVVKVLPSKGEQLVVLDNGGTNFYRYPEKLTHERPDSWERIEEDASGDWGRHDDDR